MDTQVATTPLARLETTKRRRPPGIWRQGWFRFRRNRGGMLGLALVSCVVLMACLCWAVAPYAPND